MAGIDTTKRERVRTEEESNGKVAADYQLQCSAKLIISMSCSLAPLNCDCVEAGVIMGQ